MVRNNQELVLVPVIQGLDPITTAVLYAKEARCYLRISSAAFYALVKAGIIKQYTHMNGKRPFFLKHELDAYLGMLPEYTERVSEPDSGEENSAK